MSTELQSLLQRYEQCLVDTFTLSSSFAGIVDRRLDGRRRRLLFLFLILLIMYLCKILLYFSLKMVSPASVRQQPVLALFSRSTSECMGRVSVLYEVALCFGMLLGILYKITLLSKESTNQLYFATDFTSFMSSDHQEKRSLKKLMPESEQRLIRLLRYCLFAFKLLNPCVCMQFSGLHIVMCIVSVYHSESSILSAYYVFFTLYIVLLFQTCLYPVFTVHIMTVISSEYTIQRLKDLLDKQERFVFKTKACGRRDSRRLVSFLKEYNDICSVISRHNKTVSPILLQSFVGLLPTFACIFTFNAFDFQPLLKGMLMTLAATFCTTMFTLLANAARVYKHSKKPMGLFFSMQVRKRLCSKEKSALLLLIHRIGETVDGISFTCGIQVPFTTATVLLLLLESASYTFLIMEHFFYAQNAAL